MVGSYEACREWTLVNDYTIHEQERLSDRPKMLTSVPQGVHASLHDVQAICGTEWASMRDMFDASEAERTYEPIDQIRCRAALDDRIVVFSLEHGMVGSFQEIRNVFIRPIDQETVGGKNNASTISGVGYSGMSSREVPEAGLMDGEPGTLYYMNNESSRSSYGLFEGEGIHAELNLGRAEFYRIFDALRTNSSDIDVGHALFCIELFQDEMEASLSEPWMTQNYGLRLKGDVGEDAFTATCGRIDRISFSFGRRGKIKDPGQSADIDEDVEYAVEPIEEMRDTSREDQRHLELLASHQRISRRLLWGNVLLVCLIVVLSLGIA